MGASRDAFYRYKSFKDEGDMETLIEQTSRKPNSKNPVDEYNELRLSGKLCALPIYKFVGTGMLCVLFGAWY